jgi:hypothetical protein
MLAQQIKEELNSFKMVSVTRPISIGQSINAFTRRWKSMKRQSHIHTSFNEHTPDSILQPHSDDDDIHKDIGIHSGINSGSPKRGLHVLYHGNWDFLYYGKALQY